MQTTLIKLQIHKREPIESTHQTQSRNFHSLL